MQTDVSAIADWSAANKLPINLEKSVALHYGKANPRQQYVMDKHVIKSANYVVDLGVCRRPWCMSSRHIFLRGAYSSHCLQSRKNRWNGAQSL